GVLVGLLNNTLFGWWWLDPAIALLIAALAVCEGREAWHGESCTCAAIPGLDARETDCHDDRCARSTRTTSTTTVMTRARSSPTLPRSARTPHSRKPAIELALIRGFMAIEVVAGGSLRPRPRKVSSA